MGSPPRLSPDLGNVCFASAKHGWCFSLYSFSKVYTDYHGGISPKELAVRKSAVLNLVHSLFPTLAQLQPQPYSSL